MSPTTLPRALPPVFLKICHACQLQGSHGPFWVETSAHKNPESTSLSKEDSEVLGCHPSLLFCTPAVWDLPLSSPTGRSSWWRKILSGSRSSNGRTLLRVGQGVQCVGRPRRLFSTFGNMSSRRHFVHLNASHRFARPDVDVNPAVPPLGNGCGS